MTDGDKYLDASVRHDFMFLFDVKDGNPNGDPDAGNMPRIDPETGHGLVTDVCLKRKVRNYVDVTGGNKDGMQIYVRDDGVALNTRHKEAYDDLGLKVTGTKQKREDAERARDYMAKKYFDVRMFGAVMTTGVNCGQVRGPVQLTFSRSIDPIVPMDVAITRVAITRPEDAEVVVAEDGDASSTSSGGKRTEMGRKSIVPYGLYAGYGFYSAALAEQTEASQDDLAIFWKALQGMWDLDRSSSRGLMALRGLYVFSHNSKLGEAPAHDLFDRIKVNRNEGVESPRAFSEYAITVGQEGLPKGVTLNSLVGSA